LSLWKRTATLARTAQCSAWRDVHAISTHMMMGFEAAGQNFGRLALGLPLNERDPFF
jgi:hypothetical protein